jgi:hypothetical protein
LERDATISARGFLLTLLVRGGHLPESLPLKERFEDIMFRGDSVAVTVAAPIDWVESVGNLHFPPKADHRLQELMDCSNDGTLSESERQELEALVELSEQMSIVRAAALQILGKRLP